MNPSPSLDIQRIGGVVAEEVEAGSVERDALAHTDLVLEVVTQIHNACV